MHVCLYNSRWKYIFLSSAYQSTYLNSHISSSLPVLVSKLSGQRVGLQRGNVSMPHVWWSMQQPIIYGNWHCLVAFLGVDLQSRVVPTIWTPCEDRKVSCRLFFSTNFQKYMMHIESKHCCVILSLIHLSMFICVIFNCYSYLASDYYHMFCIIYVLVGIYMLCYGYSETQ